MRTYTEAEVVHAAGRAGISKEGLDRLRAELSGGQADRSGFEAAHVAYYLGALLICGAMGWFVTDAWDHLAGITLFAVAVVYAAVFGGTGYALSRKPSTWVPGGVLTTVAVCMTPLAVYGLERQIGWWPSGDPGAYSHFHPYINASWLLMEACTILAAGIALRIVRFPFLTAPAAYAFWYMSMDAPRLFGLSLTLHTEAWITVGFGVVLLGIAWFADGERELDLAFWFYLFGLLALTGGLLALGSGKQSGLLLFGLLHLLMLPCALVLQRRVFLVFGAIGTFIFLATEATRFFRNSLGFSVALTLIGVVMIAAGIFYKRHEARLSAALFKLMPQRVLHHHAHGVGPA